MFGSGEAAKKIEVVCKARANVTERLVIGIGSSGAMELPHLNDQRYQQACAPRWRPTNFQAYGQQLMSSPVGLGLGPSVRGGVVSEGDQPPKFMLDESMLTDLMDLDPLSDQLGDGWGMGGNNQGGDYGMPCLNYFTSSSSPIASGVSPMYSNGNSNINISIASNHHQQQHEYLPPQHHHASDANSHSSTPVSLSFTQRAATSASDSAGSVGSLTHMLLSDNKLGAEDTSSKDHASLNSSSLRCSYVRNASAVPGSQGGSPDAARKNSSPSSQCGNQREEEKSLGEVKDSERIKLQTDDQVGSRKSRGILRGPRPPFLLRDRMTQALRFIGRLRVDMLAQVWMPVTKGNKTYLTSKEQPYVLEHKNDQLWLYRSISESFEFPIEKELGSVLGLPGRVFQNQIPEWTPNVQFYTSQEYSRVKEAQRCDVRGSIAVPVFDPLTRKCLAVIELVGRAEKVQYGPDLEIIHRALQVILSTSPLMIGY